MFIDQNCSHQTQSLDETKILEFLINTPNWQYDVQTQSVSRSFKFKQYSQGPEFAVLVGVMADQQDHHPDIHIYYRKCTIAFTTHSAKGVSINDFICATKTNQIYDQLINA